MKGAPSNFPKNRGGVAKGAPINIPTILTIFRIILTIPVGVGLVADGLPGKIIATLCFVLASATDLLDGKIARKYKKVTDLGAFLDPLADKILINIVFLIFVTLGIMPMWMFVVILVRDYAVDGLRMMAARKGKTISAMMLGKIKTTVQMITVISMMLNLMLGLEWLGMINDVLLYVVVALTMISGAVYLYRGRQYVL